MYVCVRMMHLKGKRIPEQAYYKTQKIPGGLKLTDFKTIGT